MNKKLAFIILLDMRKKEIQLIISFNTTSDAMAFENICKKSNCPGRLIPTPRAISAGCGMAWAAPLDNKGEILSLINEKCCSYSGVHEVELFV